MIESRVLVTGATGMVGSAIVRALLKWKRAVRVLARNSERARALFGASVEIAVGDLQDVTGLCRACEGVGEIYHVAGAVDIHEHTNGEIFDTNVEGTRRLLEAARAQHISRIVYTSSVSVYGDRLPLGVAEDAPFNPAGIYGLSKLRAEQLLQDFVEGGIRGMIVRPCIVYGPGDRYFLPQAVDVMKLPVVPLPDGGRHVVDVVHADDLAAAHLLVMEKGLPGEAYNVTDGGRYQLRDLIHWMTEMLNRSPWRPSIPRWFAARIRPFVKIAGRLVNQRELAHLRREDLDAFFSDYHFDISKVTALGYAPRIGANTGLRSALTGSGLG